MGTTLHPGSRRQIAVVLCLSIGIPLACLVLLALGVYAVITPKHFAILRYGGVACATSADRRAVYVQMALTESDRYPLLDTAELNGTSHASLVRFGWVAPPLGYAPGETRPSMGELAKAFSGSSHPRPLPATQSNLLLKLTVDPAQPASVDGVTVLIDNGEPAYYQTLIFHLKLRDGHCSVTKVRPVNNDFDELASNEPVSSAGRGSGAN